MVIVFAILRTSHTYELRKLLSQNGFRIYLQNVKENIPEDIKENYNLPETIPSSVQDESNNFVYYCIYNNSKEFPPQEEEVRKALRNGKARGIVVQYSFEEK